jgi:endonuclease/exonuclease/phosphatase family metal-dependent hydrolase
VRLRIGTWNCFGQGQGIDAVLALRAPHDHRFEDEAVLKGCCEVDVLCMQEILSRAAQRLFDGLDAQHFISRFRDDNRPRLDASMRGCGLGIAARYPLDGVTIRMFRSERVGWDRLARKGILYGRVQIDERHSVDIANVHLQAGYDPAAQRVRFVQLGHLREVIAEVGSPERPFVICGDFNICGLAAARGASGYAELTAALEDFVDLGREADLPTLHPHPEGNRLAYTFEPNAASQRVDYIFVRPTPEVTSVSVARFFDRPIPSGWASDHYGLCATLDFDRRS